MKVLILHGSNVDSLKYKEALCKKYKFLQDKEMYTLMTFSIDKKINRKFDKLYIDASSVNHTDERILQLIVKNPNATVIWINKKNGKMKATFIAPIKKLEQK